MALWSVTKLTNERRWKRGSWAGGGVNIAYAIPGLIRAEAELLTMRGVIPDIANPIKRVSDLTGYECQPKRKLNSRGERFKRS